MKLVWAIALLLSGCASPQWEAAVFCRNNPGRDCAEYARAVRDGMIEARHASYLVTYTIRYNEPVPQYSRHQVVMYYVGQERWMMDNVGRKPVWVGMANEPIERSVEQFHAPLWVHVSSVVVE